MKGVATSCVCVVALAEGRGRGEGYFHDAGVGSLVGGLEAKSSLARALAYGANAH